ncbi:pimeloyl-ACP methyl ester carboxylesterase [Mesonia algae]|uniref:Pimeloyl-ACP methyl ester carboxylesterase n=1 Tax=Mesonia algae TaxID=213248 RepID=A0A2W7HZX4_9FLAO|nr:alpha/beta hydrolase [Mesonia algae]PZW38555.1 pimeloyl-ACP methyl ester carboxylesterase [Mesonia algae]
MKKKFQKYLPKIIGMQLNSQHLIQPQKAASKAFYLFCSPRRGRVKPEQEDFLNNAKAEVFNFQNKKIQTYRWPGSKKRILLVHGWESNTHRWEEFIKKLQKEDYDIFAFDAPAHGYSEGKIINVPLYASALQEMVNQITPSIIVGHSIGAMTTVFHQHQYNNNVEKLVLLGPPSELSSIMDDYQKILKLKPRVMKSLEDYFHQQLGYRFKEFSIAKFAKAIRQPGLIIHDEYDKIAPISASKAINNEWKNSKLIITEGAGHSLNNDSIHNNILNFINN